MDISTRQRWQKQRRQDGNDGDDHQQLNQREAACPPGGMGGAHGFLPPGYDDGMKDDGNVINDNRNAPALSRRKAELSWRSRLGRADAARADVVGKVRHLPISVVVGESCIAQ